MKRVIVFQHLAHEILGTLNPILRKAGFRVRYVNYGRQIEHRFSVLDYDGLVVLGGPMAVWETEQHPHLKAEIDHIRNMIAANRPILGICLGAQLIAASLGARNYRAAEKEIGWYEVSLTREGETDPLFKHFRKSEKIFHWHSDTFDLPSGSTLLATSPSCPQQAFRYGDKVYGLQFHLEADAAMIERWLKVPAMAKELEQSRRKFDA